MSETAQVEVAVNSALTKVKKTKAKVEVTDLIQDTAMLIENLSKEKALTMADTLVEADEFGTFKLGGLFAVIQDRGWYEGYASFGEFVQDRYNKSYRVAMYYIGIYTALVNSKVEWEAVKDVGWTKLRILSNILTAANAGEWIEKAKVLTCKQLADAVKTAESQGEGAQAGESNTVTSTVSNLTFKVHEDQKAVIREALDKAKAETHTEFDTVALDNICTAYLGGAVEIEIKEGEGLVSILSKHSYQEILEAFGQVYPDVNITVEL